MLCASSLAQENTAEDWYKKGRDLAKNGSYEEAVFAYNRAIELEPNNATFYTAIVPNLNMLARFLESDTKTNILSTPNLITLDNEEAKIVVGKNVPFVTGTYATTATVGGASPFTTVERKDVGLTLKVKPQISEGGTVRLQIYQEVSSVVNQNVSQGVADATAGLVMSPVNSLNTATSVA